MSYHGSYGSYFGGYPPGPEYGYGAPPPYPPYPVGRPTNSMAIAALVSSLVLAPLGIVFGHISLSQIKRTGEDGRGLAIAGLAIGYVGTALAVLVVVVAVAFMAIVDPALHDSRGTTRHRPGTSPSEAPDGSARTIKNAKVGDCIQRLQGPRQKDGTRRVSVWPATCGSGSATDKVTKRTSTTSDCPDDQWVQTKAYTPPVVLCLSKLR